MLLLWQHCGLIKFFISIINIRQHRIITIIFLLIKTTQYSNIFKNYLYHHWNDASLIFLITNFLIFFNICFTNIYLSLDNCSYNCKYYSTFFWFDKRSWNNNLLKFNFVNIFYKYFLPKKKSLHNIIYMP